MITRPVTQKAMAMRFPPAAAQRFGQFMPKVGGLHGRHQILEVRLR